MSSNKDTSDMRAIAPPQTRKDLLLTLPSLSNRNKAKTITNEKERLDLVNVGELTKIYKHTKEKANSIKDLLIENPDIELAVQIMVTSMVSPQDMLTTNLTSSAKGSLMPENTVRDCVEIIDAECREHYKFQDDVYTWAEKAYNPGAYVKVCIGDKQQDNIINIDTEQFKEDKYAIETGTVEELQIDKTFNVTNNFGQLRKRNAKLNDFDMESNKDSIASKLMKLEKMIMLEEIGGDENVDRPLMIDWPMESTIPICLKNEPSKHLLYILMHDENGNPLTGIKKIATRELSSLEKSYASMHGSEKTSRDNIDNNDILAPMLNNTTLIKQVLNKKIDKVLSAENVSGYISDTDYDLIRRMMLSTAISKNKVNMIIMPASAVSYLTFDYKDNGVGKSVLEDLIITGGIRSMLRYTSLSALVQNATQLTKMKIKLDDDDKDLEVRIQEAYDLVYSNRSDIVPFGLLKLNDISDWLKQAGVLIEFEHANLPEIRFDLERIDRDKQVPDEKLDEKLAKSQYMKMQLSPEMVENSKDINFAEEIKNSNVLFKRRIRSKMKVINKFLSHLQRSVLINDGIVMTKIKNVIINDLASIKRHLVKGGKTKTFIDELSDKDIISMCYANLINVSSLSLQDIESDEENFNSKVFESFVSSIDKILEESFTEDMFPSDMVGDSGEYVEYIRAMYKSSAIRRWLHKNGYYRDTLKMYDSSNGDVTLPLLDEHMNFAENMTEGLKDFFKKMRNIKKKNNRMYEKFNAEIEDEPEPTTPEPTKDEPTKDESEEKPKDEDNKELDDTPKGEEESGTKEEIGDVPEPPEVSNI